MAISPHFSLRICCLSCSASSRCPLSHACLSFMTISRWRSDQSVRYASSEYLQRLGGACAAQYEQTSSENFRWNRWKRSWCLASRGRGSSSHTSNSLFSMNASDVLPVLDSRGTLSDQRSNFGTHVS